eukprot:1059055-Prorocentrum_minimum.AAC.1
MRISFCVESAHLVLLREHTLHQRPRSGAVVLPVGGSAIARVLRVVGAQHYHHHVPLVLQQRLREKGSTRSLSPCLAAPPPEKSKFPPIVRGRFRRHGR